MSNFDSVINDIDAALVKLNAARAALGQMKEESEAIEKARDALRGRKRKPKNSS